MNAVDDNSSLEQLCWFESYDTIPEDEEGQKIERVLLAGSGFERGKERIRDFALRDTSTVEFANMLKDEYGTGGRSFISAGIYHEIHDPSGIEFKWRTIDDEERVTQVTWSKAAAIILNLVKSERY